MASLAPLDLGRINVHWFPSHMARGIQAMERRIKKMDVIIEVRDARIPFSSANPILETIGRDAGKRIVVFNKTDLADERATKRLQEYLWANSKIEFMIMDSTNRKQMSHLLERIKGHCLPLARDDPEKKFKMIVSGIPNVGKSTIINRLRAIGTNVAGKAVRTGGLPGITRAVGEYVRISPFPRLYMLDSPGVLMPKIVDSEVGLKIALTGGMLDRVVGQYQLAEYCLHILNQQGKQDRYVKYFGLTAPTKKLEELLPQVAAKMNQVQYGSVNMINTASIFLRLFRTGEFGRMTLDDIPR